MMIKLCPCHSKKPYEHCCKPYHDGTPAENALLLMRSRYSAYALGLTSYIIDTTHPDNPIYNPNFVEWRESILTFSKKTKFEGLSILDFEEKGNRATVTFKALLTQGKNDGSFTEKSTFLKVNGIWLYRGGDIL